MHYTNTTLKEEREMAVTRSTEGTERTSKKSTSTAKASAAPKTAAGDSTTAKKAPAKTTPAAGKAKKAAGKATKVAVAAQATPTPETTPEPGPATEPPRVEITAEEKLKMIAEAAYFRAERRGFVGGNPAEDWIAAEAEVEARLSQLSAQKK